MGCLNINGHEYLDIREQFPKVVASKKTAWQELELRSGRTFGKGLFSNGMMQSCSKEQAFYHRAMLNFAPKRGKTALVLGVGPGGLIPLLNRYTYVRVIDIDGGAVEFYREHMPEWCDARAWNRVVFTETDMMSAGGQALIMSESWDLIVNDVAEPDLSSLNTDKVRKVAIPSLSPTGLYIEHVGGLDLRMQKETKAKMRRIKRAVKDPLFWAVDQTCFGCPWVFAASGNVTLPRQLAIPLLYDNN